MWKVLLVDQNNWFADEVAQRIEGSDKKLVIARDADTAIKMLQGEQFHLIVISDELPDRGCFRILELAMMIDEAMPVNLILLQYQLEDFKDIIKPYTWSVLEGVVTVDTLLNTIHNTIKEIKLNHKIRYLTHTQKYICKFDNIVGVSPKIQEVFSFIKKVAKSDSTVLIQGETGTGKELIAAALHYNSLRCQENFVAVNCATLNENLLESELFGHEKGSFTGAHNLRIGRFEQANCGTLFLDEVGEMSLSVQAKVLRVLQKQEFERVGGSKTIKVNVRVIAATNRDLLKEVSEGRFRQDLYYRLSVIPITIPPLRERKEDIAPLAAYFFNKYKKRGGKELIGFHPACYTILEKYHWPGNVRELENVIERAVLVTSNESILPEDLLIPNTLRPDSNTLQSNPLPGRPAAQSHDSGHDDGFHLVLPPGGVSLKAVEQELIIQALRMSKGVQKDAARLLGISCRVINYKIKKYRLQESGKPFRKE
ncbi:MAG: sigma-54 dependent transcriptional regulator [bacterium]